MRLGEKPEESLTGYFPPKLTPNIALLQLILKIKGDVSWIGKQSFKLLLPVTRVTQLEM